MPTPTPVANNELKPAATRAASPVRREAVVALVAAVVFGLPGLACDRDNPMNPAHQYQQGQEIASGHEANTHLNEIAETARSYYMRDRVSPTGQRLPHQFPDSSGMTPGVIPCRRSADGARADWDHPTWRALEFRAPDRGNFAYEFTSFGSGEFSTFQVSAYVDLDCDGVVSTHTISGQVAGQDVTYSRTPVVSNPGE